MPRGAWFERARWLDGPTCYHCGPIRGVAYIPKTKFGHYKARKGAALGYGWHVDALCASAAAYLSAGHLSDRYLVQPHLRRETVGDAGRFL